MINLRKNRLLIIGLVLSFIGHLSFLPIKFEQALDSIVSKKKTESRIKLRFAPPAHKEKQQIVTTSNTNEMKPKDSKLLSEKNNYVVKQTRAKKVAAFKEAGLGNNKVTDQKQQTATEKKKKQTASKKPKKNLDKTKKKISFKDFAFAANKKVKKRSNMVKGSRNGAKNKKGIASNNDYLEEVPLGDMTRLNTQEFKYYGFYFRIKQQLEQYWGSSIKEKITKVYKRDGRFPASDKFLTSVKVVLDKKGQIVDVVIKGSSGVSELDDAAIESFNRAGPFPNPPEGMMVNGKASIEWGFAVTNS